MINTNKCLCIELQFGSDEIGGISVRDAASIVDRSQIDAFEILPVGTSDSSQQLVDGNNCHEDVSSSDHEEPAELPAAGGHRLRQRSRTDLRRGQWHP